MTDYDNTSESPPDIQPLLRIDTGIDMSMETLQRALEVVPPSLVYTSISGHRVEVDAETGPNSALGRLNTRDLLVLQAFLSNAQTVVNVEMRRRNGMHDQITPW